MKYISIGKIVNTHGIKGELRLLSKFEFKDRVFVPGMKIFIGKGKAEEEISGFRHHKNFEMITLKGYDNINQVLKYKGDFCYIDAEDLKLADDEYLDADLINVMCYVDDKEIGRVKRVEEVSVGRKVLIVGVENGEAMIPFVKDFVHFDKKNKIILLTIPEGLI